MVYGIKKSFSDKNLSFWQSESWKTLLEKTGYAKEVFYYGGAGETCMLVEIRSLGYGLFGAFSLGVRNAQIGKDFDEFQNQLGLFLQSKGVLFLQIEPLEEILPLQKFTIGSYKNFLTPYTRIIDMENSAEDILASMHEKGRYNIRLAQKRGVHIEAVSPTEENLDIWMNLVRETTIRDSFSGNSRKYYQTFLGLEEAKMFFASYESRVIAAGIFVYTPDVAIYYYGASSSHKEDRKHMAPYLLQWHAMSFAKEKGSALYDLLGVNNPNDPHDPLVGVSQFKEKFGGRVIRFPEKRIFFYGISGKILFLIKNWKEKFFH